MDNTLLLKEVLGMSTFMQLHAAIDNGKNHSESILNCHRYRGEKLNKFVSSSSKRRKCMKDVIISTVYDTPEEIEDTVLRTGPPSTLKHRSAKFLGGGVLYSKPDLDTNDS